MRKFLITMVAGITMLAGATYAYVYTHPTEAFAWALKHERSRADLALSSLAVGEDRWPYLEGGEGPTILMLHGFGGNKDNWTRFAGALTDRYRVIAPDLPGFGDNARHPDQSYDIATQRARLAEFVTALGLQRFHLVGNSMGGNLAGAYAGAHPEQIITLGLFDAAGVESPKPSDLAVFYEETGEMPLIPRSRSEYDRLMDFVFVDRPWAPGFVYEALAAQAIRHADFRQKVFVEYRQNLFRLEPILPTITAPTLVLWGAEDKLIHVSAANVMSDLLPNAELEILSGIGHCPMIEAPQTTATLYADFLGSHADSL